MSTTYRSYNEPNTPNAVKILSGNAGTVYFGSKYTVNDAGEVKTELIIFENKDRDGAISVGTLNNRKSGIDWNSNADNVKVGKSQLNFSDLGATNKNTFLTEIKNNSNKPETWEALGINNDQQKVNNFLESQGISEKEIDEKLIGDTVNAKNAKNNLNLLKKSKQFRKTYGNYCYPVEMKNTNQDRLKITVLDFIPQNFEVDENTFNPSRTEEETIRGSVILPIPNGVTDQNKVKFGDGTLNPAQVAGAQLALNTLLGGFDAGSNTLSEQIKSLAGNEGTAAAVANLLTGAVIGTNPNQLLSRTAGAVFNNNLSLLFNGPTLRPFNFNFNVSPRDQPESIEVLKIIRMFKQSSAVQRTTKGLYLGTPHIFRLQFLSNGKPHKFLPKIKDCALLSFSTNYMPNNNYMTYENSSMVAYNLQFSFQELDPIFNDDYDKIDEEFGELKSFEELTSVDPSNEEAVSISFDDSTGGSIPDSGGIGF